MLDDLKMPLDRRSFLKAGATVGGGLALTIALPVLRPAWAAGETPPAYAPNAFIRIDRQGIVRSWRSASTRSG